MYPLPGIFLGILCSIQLYFLYYYTSFSPIIIVFWLLFFSVIYSGGLHLDGWMDVSDAILSHRDRERKLEIMKDSRVGAFAVLSVLFLLGWKLLFMYEIFTNEGINMMYYLFLVPFLTRAFIGIMLYYGRAARSEGMVAFLKRFTTKQTVISVLLWIIVVTTILFFLAPDLIYNWFILLGTMVIFTAICLRFYDKQLGGITGDTIGASVEGSETVLWMMLWLLLC